jgi:hypothetical protein
VEEILEALGIEKPWGQITAMAGRAGFGSLPLEGAFKDAATERHTAAHQAAAGVEVPDLVDHLRNIRAIALGFDVLASRGGQRLLEGDMRVAHGTGAIRASHLELRFVSAVGSKWVDKSERAVRARRRHDSKEQAILEAMSIARASRNPVVCLGSDGRAIQWFTTDLEWILYTRHPRDTECDE